ncbi:hypothetical protein [Streptomyces triticiradicis]|uniref:Uncharacterized protein n=1 Tax=Streptomyces triticiradicis TaxID=2651189 RepID=A0A7J5D5M0_9ACTN|nr:hypothetical protein [Streptomyces triticiradicis]KAB1979274.1 hypothetical protein F8144_36530 [Streptomyces triticiradicis]
MLRVVYHPANLEAGRLSDWYEDRGFVEFRVARDTKASQFIPSLNETLRNFLTHGHWYQVWEGEVVSADHPSSPIRVTFEPSPFHPAPPVDLREHKGHVAVYLAPTATIEEIAPILNASVEEVLDGGQWFQLWHGEIVTMDSPDSMAA